MNVAVYIYVCWELGKKEKRWEKKNRKWKSKDKNRVCEGTKNASETCTKYNLCHKSPIQNEQYYISLKLHIKITF